MRWKRAGDGFFAFGFSFASGHGKREEFLQKVPCKAPRFQLPSTSKGTVLLSQCCALQHDVAAVADSQARMATHGGIMRKTGSFGEQRSVPLVYLPTPRRGFCFSSGFMKCAH